MNKSIPLPFARTNPNHTLQPLLFGILIAVVLAVDGMPQARHLSPFAGTAVAVLFGAMACILANARVLWSAHLPTKDALTKAFLAGVLVCFGVFFVLLGLNLQAHLLCVAICATLLPAFSLLGRKMFWGEALSAKSRAGMMMSFCAAGLWLMVDSNSGFWGTRLLPSSLSPFFAGNTSVFCGTLLLGFATSLARPADYGIPAAAYWSWVNLAAAAVAVPTMGIAQRVLIGVPETAGIFSGTNIQSANIQSVFVLCLPSALLGVAFLCFRVVYLTRSSLALSTNTTARLWTGAALATSTFLAYSLHQSLPPVHLLTLPLHAVGLWLASRSTSSTAAFVGLTEASVERRVA